MMFADNQTQRSPREKVVQKNPKGTPASPPLSSRKTGSSSSSSKGPVVLSWFWFLCRVGLVDIPLVALVGTCAATYGLQSIYQVYYVPLMDRSTRTDKDLHREFTYYHRRCTAQDITTRNLTELIVPTTPTMEERSSSSLFSAGVDMAQDVLMTHGVVLLPQILKPETVQKLREYAVYRNRVIPEHEQYPVSQGHKRISFGYDATEHPALIQAVREVTHNRFLRQLLQQILGDHDPASTEITTITQYYGAPEQAWHSDTKEDGNALKFARTYSHSYSLFLPLQNTTRKMGATEICPGTHYCANDLYDVCDNAMGGRGLHAAYQPEETFPAGDAALLNQHVWHRGAPHRDEESLERVVFVMSFIARPDRSGDTRQLSRGTYFHQKWNMWGHTWRDLMDPLRYMQAPYSYLKCLSLWSASSNWGYDLVTATYMRFSNAQLGGDLTRLVHIWEDVLHWPEWLHGPNLEEEEEEKTAWTTFIEETIAILLQYLKQLTIGVHAMYFVLLFLFSATLRNAKSNEQATPGESLFRKALTRYLVANGMVLLLIGCALYKIQCSAWAQNALKGKSLMRPFPPAARRSMEEELVGVVSSGPTTFPSTLDVLLGTRFDAPWLGAYERWLDGHPGNRRFQQVISELAPSYSLKAASTPPSQRRTLSSALVDAAVYKVVEENQGRFLQQNYRTGDWRVQTVQDNQQTVQLELACAALPVLEALRTRLDRSMDLLRFGTVLRSTALARKAALFAWRLRMKLAGIPLRLQVQDGSMVRTSVSETSTPVSFRRWKLPVIRMESRSSLQLLTWRAGWPIQPGGQDDFRLGAPVWAYLTEEDRHGNTNKAWYRGDIVALNKNKQESTVALETGEIQVHVPFHELEHYRPVEEGDVVQGCFSTDGELEDCYEGIAVHVMPDGSAAIAYKDGDFDARKHPAEYYVPPYAYVLPDED